MKQAIGDGVRFQSSDGRDRMVVSVAEHVVPLKQLVEDDAVDEATQAQPEQEPR